MSFRSLGLAALAGILLIALLTAFLAPSLNTDSRFWYTTISRMLLLGMVAIASGLAASRFGWWSEYVGRAWTLFFVEYAVLTAGEVVKRAFPQQTLAGEICVVAANVAGIGAYLLMARAMSAAGLTALGSPLRKALLTILAVTLAVALCYAPILSGLQSLASADPRPGSLVSPLADVITFVLVAPLLLTTFSLRGGQMFWMFAFLTTGTIGWMVNQGAATLIRFAGGGDDAIRTGRMTGFAMACFLIAAAALTQWLAAQRTLKGAAAHA